MDFAPYRLSGRVYGTLLNHPSAVEALGDAVDHAPYKSPPRAPVLYIKPRNTLAADGERVTVPVDAHELEAGACIGLVMGRFASRVSEADALDHVAGYVLVNDVSVPHLPYYRPAIRFKARDGFCPIGPRVVRRIEISNPDDLWVSVFVDGELRQSLSTKTLLRPMRRLLADVTEFMTLAPGDVLAVGAAGHAPRVRAGQTVTIDSVELGKLQNPFVGASQ